MTSADTRYLIGDGDKTGTGGYQSASSTSTNMGKRIALEGDYASCPACKAGGPVYNDCDPRWYENGKAVLVEGARVFCQCKEKPRVFASQRTMSTEVVSGNTGATAPTVLSPSQWVDASRHKASHRDTATALADHPTLICPNMTNDAFAALAMDLCAILVARTEARLAELRRWDAEARRNVQTWFGVTDSRTRETLSSGLGRMLAVFRRLRPANFVRYSPSALEFVGCVSKPDAEKRGVVAAVCKPDVKTHTIAIALNFCEMPDDHDCKDSQLLTLAHEVSHFHDTMDTEDHHYFLWNAIALARARHPACITNADNVAGYVVVHGPIPDSFGVGMR
jgi:uncharacterized Zn-binding protein involved in type VI secretion